MKIEKDDYVIAWSGKDRKAKTVLMKVTNVSDREVAGVIEKFSHIPTLRRDAVFLKSDCLSLGPNPRGGRAYGCDTGTLHRGKKIHDYFGTVHFFYKPEKEVGADLFKAMTRVGKSLEGAGLGFLLNPEISIWEVMPFHNEKYAGMYTRSRNTEKLPHAFMIRPEIMPAPHYPYVLYHEIGHHLHLEHVTSKKLNAAWLSLYKETVQEGRVTKEKCKEFLDKLLDQTEVMPSQFKSVLSEEDTKLYKIVLSHIQKQHSISAKELDVLFEAENEYWDVIREIWPVRGVSTKELKPSVSLYSTKSVRELFAESFAFYMTKEQKLPKEVVRLLEKSIQFAKANRERS